VAQKEECAMQSPVFLIATILTVLAAPAARSDTITCTAADELQGHGQRKTDLALDVHGDAIVGLRYVVTIADGKGTAVDVCRIEVSEGDGLSRWSRSGAAIKVFDKKSIEDEVESSYTEVETLPGGYRLNLAHISRNHCASDADIPATVTLKKGEKACSVTYKAAAR
jgi:hypothetical protein